LEIYLAAASDVDQFPGVAGFRSSNDHHVEWANKSYNKEEEACAEGNSGPNRQVQAAVVTQCYRF
jgi:hypothetical protein